MNDLKRKQPPHKIEYKKKMSYNSKLKSKENKINPKISLNLKKESPEASQTVSDDTFDDFILRWYQSKEITEQQKDKFLLIKQMVDLYVERQGLRRSLFYEDALIYNAFNFFNLVNNN